MPPSDATAASERDTSTMPPAQTTTTRRAMVSHAVAGIDSFKKSWISVMLLKSSIGLGQVVTLITLLVLAHALDSPLAPHAKQTARSGACPRPHLLQAWVGASIARLAICWSVSCWMCVRYQRAERRASSPAMVDEETPDAADNIRPTAVEIPHSNTLPSLSHSDSSRSCSTLDETSSLPHTPDTLYSATVGSTASIAAIEVISALPKSTSSDLGVLDVRPAPAHAHATRHLSTRESTTVDHDALASVRALHAERAIDTIDADQSIPTRRSSLASRLDRIAPTISKTLGLISAMLFVLGNVLLFHPTPTSNQTCYHASPMLWWAVALVIIIGWILLAQVFLLVIVVGIGGQAVLAILRRVGIAATPAEPEPPRAALPDPLAPGDLARLELVVYLPVIGESAPRDQTPDAHVDRSRLAHRPIHLPPNRATCAICQEAFVPPEEGRTIMLRAHPLRLLGCGHVFHAECIDQWLLCGHGNCPFCNQCVRTLWARQDRGPALAQREKKGFFVRVARSAA